MSLDDVLTRTPLVTMDELMRAYSRLSLNDDERQGIVDCFGTRMKAGWRLSPMPLNAGLEDASREAKRALVQQLSAQGAALVTSFDLGATLLILKTDAGTGFLGRQKVAYVCFVTESNDGFERAGVAPTISRAFGILDSMYQIVLEAERLPSSR